MFEFVAFRINSLILGAIMKHLLKLVFISFVIVCGFVTCKKEETPPNMGYNYFPIKVGRYIVYNVDSIFYDDFTGLIDTTKFQLKEKIESVFYDNEGRSTLRLERYVKYFNDSIPYSSMNWGLRDVWASNRTSTTAEKVEENQRFIKLAFPVKENQSWNGNAQNTLGELSYEYLFFDETRTIGGIYFDSTLQVTQLEEEFLYSKKYFIEKYARNVGLIYKQVIEVYSQPPASWFGTTYEADSLALFNSIYIMNRITSGVQYTYTIQSFGNEP